MKHKLTFKHAFMIAVLVYLLLIVFTMMNAFMYQTPVGKVTDITHVKKESVTDEHKNHDTKYTDRLKIQLLNTDNKDKIYSVSHSYNQSKSEFGTYRKGDKVLLHLSKGDSQPYILEKKRDTLVIAVLGFFLLTLLFVGRKIGLTSILSLVINTALIFLAIWLHQHMLALNLFVIMSVMTVISTIITLLLVTGFKKRTLVTILSTLLGTFISIGILALVIQLTKGSGIKYETLSFLTMPPKTIFLSSVLIGSLGAVMDVAITIASGMYEIHQRSPHISTKAFMKAGQNIGQDIMGTMTNILLFSYLAGSLPMFLIYLRNGNTITYTISMNWSLEVARAITGGIGIVITIPITLLLMRLWRQKRGDKA
ncbi:hypothetical protein C273_06002 [Staphylococcus massiliensis S46]|uniref:YibE/F-like protein n=2 Tax=Staphylococcus massiliensis TaxID=555791 RepID=K9AQD6_9STAP|nr:hypothetical protein C273_06002 [Staphylococcus massiliensis S46]